MLDIDAMQAPSKFSQTEIDHRARVGRPTSEQVGEVDRRILAAAADLFLQFGFDATSCGEVATRAGAGKASIYARYANKDVLFASAIDYILEQASEQSNVFQEELSPYQRLMAVGRRVLIGALQPEAISLVRLLLTTAYRRPDVTARAGAALRGLAVRRIAEAIAGVEAAALDAVQPAVPIAVEFIEQVVLPCQLQVLFGEELVSVTDKAFMRIDQEADRLEKSGALEKWR